MKHEKLTCPDKLGELLKQFIAPGVTVDVNTVKETACSTPAVESVTFSKGEEFIVLTQTYGSMFARVKPTPKMIQKVKITGTLAGETVSRVFNSGDSTYKFENALEDVVKEDIEVPDDSN